MAVCQQFMTEKEVALPGNREAGSESANRRWLQIILFRSRTITFAAELLETEIEKRLGIRPFVRAIQQDKMQFVTVAGGRRGKGVFRAERPARLGRPHAGIHAQELVVGLQRLEAGSRLEHDAGRATNVAQFRYSY